MKFNFDVNKLITIGGIGLSAIGALLSSISNDKKMEKTVEKKVEEALNTRMERRLNGLFFFILKGVKR